MLRERPVVSHNLVNLHGIEREIEKFIRRLGGGSPAGGLDWQSQTYLQYSSNRGGVWRSLDKLHPRYSMCMYSWLNEDGFPSRCDVLDPRGACDGACPLRS